MVTVNYENIVNTLYKLAAIEHGTDKARFPASNGCKQNCISAGLVIRRASDSGPVIRLSNAALTRNRGQKLLFMKAITPITISTKRMGSPAAENARFDARAPSRARYLHTRTIYKGPHSVARLTAHSIRPPEALFTTYVKSPAEPI